MKLIEVKNNSVIISINKNIFTLKNLEIALKTYNEFFTYNINENETHFQIEIKSIDKNYSNTKLAGEFFNYLIGLEHMHK